MVYWVIIQIIILIFSILQIVRMFSLLKIKKGVPKKKVVSSNLWKKLSQKIGSDEPWKLQIFIPTGSPRAQGVALRTHKGLVPWPFNGLCPYPSSPEGRKRAQLPPFLQRRIIRVLFVNRLSRHILTGGTAPAAVFHVSIDNSPAPPAQCHFSTYSG